MLFKIKPALPLYFFQLKQLFHLKPRVMGCACFVHHLDPATDKLPPKSIRCVLLGYSRYQKEYRGFSSTLTCFFVSADMTFESEPFLPGNTLFEMPSPHLPLPVPDMPLRPNQPFEKFPGPPFVYACRSHSKALIAPTHSLNVVAAPADIPTASTTLSHTLSAFSVPHSFDEAKCHSHWRTISDYSLFVKSSFRSLVLLMVYVDDIVISRNDPTGINETTKWLHSQLHIKDR